MALQLARYVPVNRAGFLSGGGSAVTGSWTITDATDPAAPTVLKITVRDGAVTPVNTSVFTGVTLGGVLLSHVPAPTLVVTESVRIMLKRVATEGGSTRSFVDTIVSDPLTNPTQPVDIINPGDWTCYTLLGRVYVTSGAISSIIQDQTRNLYVENYGATNEVLATN